MIKNSDSLADALSVLDEDRATQEQRDFDAAYEAARLEDLEMTAAAAKRIKEKKIDEFLGALAPHFPPEFKLRGREITHDGFEVGIDRAISFWDYPALVEVTKSNGGWQKYRPGKNGYNFAKIAEAACCRARQLICQAKADCAWSANKTPAAELRAKLRVREYSGLVRPSMDPNKPIFVELKLAQSMTAEQAERVITLLQAEGLISDWNFER